MQISSVSVIGLGKLGSPILATIASRGFKAIGVDNNTNFVELINQGIAPVFEPDLQKYISENKARISATTNYREAIINSDMTCVIVPTPTADNGGFETKYAKAAMEEIGRCLKDKNSYHLVVLTSTVLPGAVEKDIIPAIEAMSGKKVGVDFGFCYNPEFIALGSVVWNLLNPDFILVGESDQRAGDTIEGFYKQYCLNNPPIKRMAIVNAELTKISINTYITNKISFANMVGMMCEQLPGGNADAVTDAMGCDARIGHKYLKAGTGYGGPCFPRDNRAINFLAKQLGLEKHALAEATDNINNQQAPYLKAKINKLLPGRGKITILGTSYKPHTNFIEESQGVILAKMLADDGYVVTVYDPAAMELTKLELKNTFFADSLKEAISNKDLVCIMTPWEEFKNLQVDDLKQENKKTIIVDCWRIIDADKLSDVIEYHAFGINTPIKKTSIESTKKSQEWTAKKRWNPFNSYKLLTHVDRWQEIKRDNRIPAPVLITIDPTNVCNFNCGWCNAQYVRHHRNHSISEKSLLAIADYLPKWGGFGEGVKSICIAGGGEPLLNPAVGRFIDRVVANGIEVGVVTNGTLIHNYIEPLSKCTWVGISVDAGFPNTFHKVKGLPENANVFNKVLENIKALTDYSKRNNTRLGMNNPAYGVSYKYLLSEDNIPEINVAAKIAKEIGCKNIHFRPASTTWDKVDTNDKIAFSEASVNQFNDLIIEAMKLDDNTFNVYGVTHKFNNQFEKNNDFEKCHAVFMTAVIQPPTNQEAHEDSITVGVCCDRRGDSKLELATNITNINEIDSLWGSDRHWKLFDDIKVNECPRCTYQPHNQIYEQVIEQDSMTHKFI